MTANNNKIIEEASKLIDEGLSVTLPVNGHSMLPFIVGGRDSVILQKPIQPKTGDVVLAWVDDCRYVVHRIIGFDGDNVTLMGDGNLTMTEHCSRSDIKAIATHIVGIDGKASYLYTRCQRWKAGVWYRLRQFRKYLLRLTFLSKKLRVKS